MDKIGTKKNITCENLEFQFQHLVFQLILFFFNWALTPAYAPSGLQYCNVWRYNKLIITPWQQGATSTCRLLKS